MTELEKRIQELRDRGYGVELEHHRGTKRLHEGKMDETEVLSEKGGSTVALIRSSPSRDAEVIARGFAHCCALDNYSRRIGGLIALGRARKELPA